MSYIHGGKPLSSITLDVDGLPIESFGSKADIAYNRHVVCTLHSPLVASIAETGDMVGGLLREGNSGNAIREDQWIPGLTDPIPSLSLE